MKQTNKIVLYILIVLLALFVLSIYVFSVSQTHDISEIGTFFGGIGSVMIGLITTVLLLITMFRQEKKDEDDNVKTESEFILQLYSQLERDYENIYTKFEQGQGEKQKTFFYTGTAALNIFINNAIFGDHPEHLNEYGNYFEAMQLHGVLKSFDLIKYAMKDLSQGDTMKRLNQKLDIFYAGKLKYACECIVAAFTKNNIQLDEKGKYLVEFYNRYNNIVA